MQDNSSETERNSTEHSRVADITPKRADIHVILMPDYRL